MALMMSVKTIISTSVAIIATGAMFACVAPFASADSAQTSAVVSSRSFPKASSVKKNLFAESTSTSVDENSKWGGIETLDVPQTESQGEKEAAAAAAAQKAADEVGGLGYLEVKEELKYKGPIDKFIPDDMKMELAEMAGLQEGDTIFFIAAPEKAACIYAGQIRNELGSRLDLLEKDAYCFCYINDFPMYEIDEETGKLGFTHNPFSMPQGGLEALNEKDPLDILAYQYDIVCNGVELSSGAVRNHDMEIMEKAFDIAGYDKETLKDKFGALYNAFQFGAPPHAGMAPGVDRMIMLLRNEENIREIIAFPMSGTAQDLMCGAPNEITEQQLREVHIKVRD